ncbi:hypothetical protein Droror1_Dr00002239 [Drosera rotundifolia]
MLVFELVRGVAARGVLARGELVRSVELVRGEELLLGVCWFVVLVLEFVRGLELVSCGTDWVCCYLRVELFIVFGFRDVGLSSSTWFSSRAAAAFVRVVLGSDSVVLGGDGVGWTGVVLRAEACGDCLQRWFDRIEAVGWARCCDVSSGGCVRGWRVPVLVVALVPNCVSPGGARFGENMIPVGLVFGLLRRYGGGFAGELRRRLVCLGLRIPACLGWCFGEVKPAVVFRWCPTGGCV